MILGDTLSGVGLDFELAVAADVVEVCNDGADLRSAAGVGGRRRADGLKIRGYFAVLMRVQTRVRIRSSAGATSVDSYNLASTCGVG